MGGQRDRSAETGQGECRRAPQGIPRDIAYTNVWHSRPTEEGIAGFTKAVFCLNPALRWETNLDGDDRTYDIGRVATHEIGHAIGLDHPGPSGQLMGYRYTEVLEGLEAGDIDGARRLYGNPRLPRSE